MNKTQGNESFNLAVNEVEFLRITDLENNDINAAMEIYTEAFPLNERQPVNVVKERIRKGLSHLYAGYIGQDIVFMALLWPLKGTDFTLLDYMATDPKYRGKNIGSGFLKTMGKGLKENGKYFILEVENPEFGENREERQKRLVFYKKNGVKELIGVRYILPPLHGSVPTEMILMIFPDYKDGKIDATIVKKIIIQIYKELYNRDADDTLFSLPTYQSKNPINLK